MEQLMQRNTLHYNRREQYLFHIIKRKHDLWWHQIGKVWKGSYIGNELSINFLKEL